MTPGEWEKYRFTLLVDALPQPEQEIVHLLFREQVPLREAAEKMGWFLESGDPDHKKVERAVPKVLALLRQLCELIRLDLNVMYLPYSEADA